MHYKLKACAHHPSFTVILSEGLNKQVNLIPSFLIPTLKYFLIP